MKHRGTIWLIHGFALLHAITTVACQMLDIQDSLLLTALTMALAVILCRWEKLTVDITVATLVLVNILGFLLGSLAAQWVFDFLPPLWQHALSTFLVTEVLGWAIYAFSYAVSPSGSARYEQEQSWHRNIGWLICAIIVVYGFRVYIDISYQGDLFRESGVIGLLVLVTVLSLAYLVALAVRMQREASSQRTRRHQAEFSYMNLKNQVNPHFLFNSLNVLDSIVQEGTREEASTYIHKMASIYRYMMQQDGKRAVPLKDEIAFARNYRHLVQIRFPEGLVIEDGIGEEIPDGFIVPCTLQLLLENAIKHNAIGPDKPLIIRATTDGQSVSVWNNRIPKRTLAASSGIGLQYVRNQYRDLAGKEILVEDNPEFFRVTVPLLAEWE